MREPYIQARHVRVFVLRRYFEFSFCAGTNPSSAMSHPTNSIQQPSCGASTGTGPGRSGTWYRLVFFLLSGGYGRRHGRRVRHMVRHTDASGSLVVQVHCLWRISCVWPGVHAVRGADGAPRGSVSCYDYRWLVLLDCIQYTAVFNCMFACNCTSRGDTHTALLICGPIRDYHTVPSTIAAVHSFNWTDTCTALLICGPIRDYHTVPSTIAAVHSFNWTDTCSASTSTRGPQPSGREGGTRLPRWRTCSVLLPQYRFHSESDARRCAMYAISCDQAEPIKAVCHHDKWRCSAACGVGCKKKDRCIPQDSARGRCAKVAVVRSTCARTFSIEHG